MHNDNITELAVDPRLNNCYEKIWDAIIAANEANPLTNAAVVGILDMVKTELLMQSLGYEVEEVYE